MKPLTSAHTYFFLFLKRSQAQTCWEPTLTSAISGGGWRAPNAQHMIHFNRVQSYSYVKPQGLGEETQMEKRANILVRQTAIQKRRPSLFSFDRDSCSSVRASIDFASVKYIVQWIYSIFYLFSCNMFYSFTHLLNEFKYLERDIYSFANY